MSKLNLMTTIVDRNQVRKYLHLYEEEGLQIMLVTLGDGTQEMCLIIWDWKQQKRQ